jgi:hypothetical protein
MLTIITELIECNEAHEVDRVVSKYMDIVSDTQGCGLCRWGNNTKRRIARIQREKKKSFSDLLN